MTQGAFADLPFPGFKIRDHIKPTWTIADEDHDGLYSFRKWFMKFYQDPTETEFVKECFEGDWKHWEVFKATKGIDEMYRLLKKEAEQKLLADTYKKILEIAMDSNNKSQMTALKYLADRGNKVTGEEGPGRGRPKKSEIAAAAREIAQEDKDLKEDLERING